MEAEYTFGDLHRARISDASGRRLPDRWAACRRASILQMMHSCPKTGLRHIETNRLVAQQTALQNYAPLIVMFLRLT